MLADCLEVFKYLLETNSEDWLVEQHIPKDGTYVLVDMDHDFRVKDVLEIIRDKKNGEIKGETAECYPYIRRLDFVTQLITMNKSDDPEKTAHSNQLFAFFVKKESIQEGKVTKEVIDGYFDTLLNIEKKYEKSKGKFLYQQIENQIGKVPVEQLESIRNWVKQIFAQPNQMEESWVKGKQYLKFFFVFSNQEKTMEAYRRENLRYVIPNIYNSNDYNVTVGTEIWGLPTNNMGLNSKKTFLEHKTRKNSVPYLKSLEDVLLQKKFFDFLSAQASAGKYNIYVDFNEKSIHSYSDKDKIPAINSGLFLRIQQGKTEIEIVNCDTIVKYSPNMIPSFHYKKILDVKENQTEVEVEKITQRKELQALVDQVFFGNRMSHQFFVVPEDVDMNNDTTLIGIFQDYRRILIRWFYQGDDGTVEEALYKMAKKIVLNSIRNGYYGKARSQLNLLWSMQDYFAQNNKQEVEKMNVRQAFNQHARERKEEWEFSGDAEYFYAVGQVVAYFISLSKAAKKPLSAVNPFLNTSSDEQIKKKLEDLFKKYNYLLEVNRLRAFKGVFSRIMAYHPTGKIQSDYIVAGVTGEIIFYAKSEKEEGEEA